MESTDEGIVICLSFVCPNAYSSITLIEFGKSTFSKVHPLNPHSSIVFTELGIITSLTSEKLNADIPIVSIPSGIL